MGTGAGNLAQIVGGDVGGHAHRDPGGPVEQHIGQAGRQQRRLIEGAVEVRHPVHGALAQFPEQDLRVGGQPRLCVAHGGEGLGLVGGAPVALAVDQRIAIGERLGHEDHGLIAGGVPVGVELAEYVADGAGGLLELGRRREPKLGHGIEDAPLHGLEAVADVGQGAVQDDVHGIVQVRLLAEDMERHALQALWVIADGLAHCLRWLAPKSAAHDGARRAGRQTL